VLSLDRGVHPEQTLSVDVTRNYIICHMASAARPVAVGRMAFMKPAS